jgi:hypothetical protein
LGAAQNIDLLRNISDLGATTVCMGIENLSGRRQYG